MAQAIILAGGDSSRYGKNKIIETFDKSTLTEYLVKFCKENQIDDIFIVINKKHVGMYKGKDLTELYHPLIDAINYSGHRINVKFVWQGEKKGPVAGLFGMQDLITDDFFVLFGDNFLKGLIEFDEEQKAADVVIGTLELPKNSDNQRLGYVDTDNRNHVMEKPHRFDEGHFFIGFAYFKAHMIKRINELKPSVRGEFEITHFINLAENIETYDMNKLRWIDITYASEYDKVLEYIKNS